MNYLISQIAKAIYTQKVDFDIWSDELTSENVRDFQKLTTCDFMKLEFNHGVNYAVFEPGVALSKIDRIDDASLKYNLYADPVIPKKIQWAITHRIIPVVESDVYVTTSDYSDSSDINVTVDKEDFLIVINTRPLTKIRDSEIILSDNSSVIGENYLIINLNQKSSAFFATFDNFIQLHRSGIDWDKITEENKAARELRVLKAIEAEAIRQEKLAAERERIRQEKLEQERIALAEAARLEAARRKAEKARLKAQKKAEEDKKRRIEQTRRLALKTLIEDGIDKRLIRSAKAAEKMKKEIAAEEAKIYEKKRELANFSLSKNKEAAAASFMADYDKIKDSDKVESVTVKDNVLHIITNDIISYDRKRDNYHNIGQIQLLMSFGSRKFINATPRRGNYCLPHTSTTRAEYTNNICQGNIADELRTYLSNYEILTAFSLIIAFFETGVDSDDTWGKRIWNFPKTSRKK